MQHKITLFFCPLPLQSGSEENLQVLLPRDKQSTKRLIIMIMIIRNDRKTVQGEHQAKLLSKMQTMWCKTRDGTSYHSSLNCTFVLVTYSCFEKDCWKKSKKFKVHVLSQKVILQISLKSWGQGNTTWKLPTIWTVGGCRVHFCTFFQQPFSKQLHECGEMIHLLRFFCWDVRVLD